MRDKHGKKKKKKKKRIFKNTQFNAFKGKGIRTFLFQNKNVD